MLKNWKQILLGLCTVFAVSGLSANEEPATEQNESSQVSQGETTKEDAQEAQSCSTCG